MSIPRYGHFVGVAQIQHAGVGILRTALDESSISLRDWHAQWLPADDEKVSAVLQIRFDCHPGIGGNSRAVRKHQELGVGEGAGSLQGLQAKKGGVQITQCRGEGGAIQRLAGNGRESRLPEDGYLGHKRRGEEYEEYGDAKECVHENTWSFMCASALKLYIRALRRMRFG